MRPSHSFLIVFSFLGMVAIGCGVDVAPGGTGGAAASGGRQGSGGGAQGGGASGGGGSLDSGCNTGVDCSLISKTCCGSCGAPTLSDMMAVIKGKEEAYRGSVCGRDLACPDCAGLPNPNLFAACVPPTSDGRPKRCVAVDLSARPEAKCVADSDCVVKPRACCECGAGSEAWNLVALRADSLSFLRENLCEANSACGKCAWIAPKEVTAICKAGVCAVKDSRPDRI